MLGGENGPPAWPEEVKPPIGLTESRPPIGIWAWSSRAGGGVASAIIAPAMATRNQRRIFMGAFLRARRIENEKGPDHPRKDSQAPKARTQTFVLSWSEIAQEKRALDCTPPPEPRSQSRSSPLGGRITTVLWRAHAGPIWVLACILTTGIED